MCATKPEVFLFKLFICFLIFTQCFYVIVSSCVLLPTSCFYLKKMMQFHKITSRCHPVTRLWTAVVGCLQNIEENMDIKHQLHVYVINISKHLCVLGLNPCV